MWCGHRQSDEKSRSILTWDRNISGIANMCTYAIGLVQYSQSTQSLYFSTPTILSNKDLITEIATNDRLRNLFRWNIRDSCPFLFFVTIFSHGFRRDLCEAIAFNYSRIESTYNYFLLAFIGVMIEVSTSCKLYTNHNDFGITKLHADVCNYSVTM